MGNFLNRVSVEVDPWSAKIPVLDRKIDFSSLQEADVPISDSDMSYNRSVINALLRRQLETGEGCFFAGLSALSHALQPDCQLPSADEIWETAWREYAHLLVPNKLLISHEHLPQAFLQVHGAWGIRISRYRLNENGQALIGPQMEKIFGPPLSVVSNEELISTESIVPPYSILLHQAGRGNSHFVTEDNSLEAAEARQSYSETKPPHRVIAVFEFESLRNLR